MHARRRLLRAANESWKKITPGCMKHIDQIAAVINDNVRLDIECLIEEYGIFFLRAAMPCKDVNALLDKRSRNIILRGQRIAARNGNLRTRVLEDRRHVGRLRLDVQGNDHLDAGKRLRDRILLVGCRHYRHKPLHPINLCVTGRCECNIPNHRLHHKSPFNFQFLFVQKRPARNSGALPSFP